jgi:uncharacterized protein (DUF2252 family)
MDADYEEALTDAERQEQGRATIHHHAHAAVACSLAGLGMLAVVWMNGSASPAPPAIMLMKTWKPPEAVKRCGWVEQQTVAKQDPLKPPEELAEQYAAQSTDANTFYRATAHLFWQDFVREGWGLYDLRVLGIDTALKDGSPVERTSTWTWVTGDQHLSNFGAWHNRRKEVVFGVNDFDEAAIFDFRIDVWRVAVSIYNHAISNGLGKAKAEASVITFTDVYLSTVEGYIGNENAGTFEVTKRTSSGKLAAFLAAVDKGGKSQKQLKKFTEVDEASGERRLLKNAKTRLEAVVPELEAEVRAAFSAEQYGATLNKIGWHAKIWSDDHFKVLDVAARLGSGVGSFGVGRYYVLLAGRDEDNEDAEDDHGIILDVKFEPEPAVLAVLDGADAAWYHNEFGNEAQRAVLAQRALTSYTDPYAGWIFLGGKAHVVRERSPYKDSFDLESVKSYAEFAEYVSHIATSTATSHVRGTASKSPGQFKEVIAAAFGATYARTTWGVAVAKVAAQYREQVLLDFECFRDFVNEQHHADAGLAKLDPSDMAAGEAGD